jgi:hypothetical protein
MVPSRNLMIIAESFGEDERRTLAFEPPSLIRDHLRIYEWLAEPAPFGADCGLLQPVAMVEKPCHR